LQLELEDQLSIIKLRLKVKCLFDFVFNIDCFA